MSAYLFKLGQARVRGALGWAIFLFVCEIIILAAIIYYIGLGLYRTYGYVRERRSHAAT
jgi:hypothetical protein